MTDHERFCMCGHNESEHSTRGNHACKAIEPDRCVCLGYRPGKRSYEKDSALLIRWETLKSRLAREKTQLCEPTFGPVWIDPREMKRRAELVTI
jgi:hypothetical protein